MFDANFIADPYPTYQQMLADGRFHWHDIGGGAWFIPHYTDVKTLLRHPHLVTALSGAF